ncbi:MAG TPA: glycosyltransferase [Acidobacteriaceae bacterium]|jgi:glycosyltransferase involved in cell wall biosynthesis|nr:glycosyltransferase [Acidobacteriaceae bacterium]
MSEPSAESRPIVFTEIEQFGGAERSALALLRWLFERGLPGHVVTYADHCGLAQFASYPLQIVELKATGARRRIAALRAHFQDRPKSAPRPLLSGYQPALHATLAGMRGFHDLMHDTPSLFDDPQTRSLRSSFRLAVSNRIVGLGLRSGGNTIVTSEHLRQECRRDFGIDAHVVRMGGMSTGNATVSFRPRTVAGELRMLSVCRIERNKRIDWILGSLAKLEQATPALSSRVNWRLDLAGKGPMLDQLTRMAASLGIRDRVRFHGFVPDSELQAMYAGAHLFLMPAVQGYGIPAIESLQRGIPVLLHRQSGVSDILLDTPWVTVLDGGEEAMTRALEAAIGGVLNGQHLQAPLPLLPTEESWAEQVARLCGWIG